MRPECKCTKNILILEFQEFHLPIFASKKLHALKVWAKIKYGGKITKGPEGIRTYIETVQDTFKSFTLTTRPQRLSYYCCISNLYYTTKKFDFFAQNPMGACYSYAKSAL